MKRRATGPARREIHVLNGANLNMLGFREPAIYGTETLADLEKTIARAAKQSGARIAIRLFQTNHEGDLLDYIHGLVKGAARKGRLAGVILNPGGWTHTSVVLRDAVLMLKPVPLVEVHLSNPAAREPFRHFSFLEDIVDHRVVGAGMDGYVEALRWIIARG